ncbi:MAG: TonB-dependent receptor plug domain-containing protein [Opitutae bacterium]|nr:TonB-dependent receptor plug domain-containing protein [Opitutae bacterium]
MPIMSVPSFRTVGRGRLLAFYLCVAAAAAQTAKPGSDQTTPAQPASASEETVVLSPFQISGKRDRGYGVTTSLGASRIALPVTDIPVSVVSINEQFFLDRGAVDAMEVLPFVSGVQQGADGSPGQEGFSLRGFSMSGIRVRDGLPESVEGADYPFDDASAYERLEIIKGPAGTLYGTTSMGGVVNKISKWPKFAPQTKVELQAQSYDEFVRAMVDSTGPIGKNTAYRLVLSSRTGKRYFDEKDAPNDFTNLLLALTHRIGADRGGRIWARAQYLHFELDRESGPQYPTGFLNPANPTAAPVLRNPKFPIAINANLEPEDDVSIGNIYSYEGGYEQTWAGPFGGNWTLRLVGRYSLGKGDKSPSYALTRPVPTDASGTIVKYTSATGTLVNGDSRFIAADDPRVADWRATMTAREFSGYKKNSGSFLDLVGDFQTGPMKHKMVINAQLDKAVAERAFFFWAVPNPANTTAVANSFSMVRPDFSRFSLTNVKATVPTQFNAFNGHSESNGFASGFQDNISVFGERVIGVVGARYDNVQTTSFSFDSAQSIAQRKFIKSPTTTSTVDNQEWTFRYGLVGKPWPGVSVFSQIGQTYIPVNTLNARGTKYPNRQGEIKEAGVKLELFGARLVTTASVFDMQLTNVLISVPNPPELGGGLVQVPAGTQKTKGFEMDVAYEPVEGLNLSLAYSKLTSTNELGQSFRGVPIDAAWSMLAKYRFRQDALRGCFVGASWRHTGKQAGDATDTFYLDNADVFDGFIGYGRQRWNVQLNFLNLLNTDDPITTVGDTAVFRALPRSYRVTFRYTF